jgi:hypothetical protein
MISRGKKHDWRANRENCVVLQIARSRSNDAGTLRRRRRLFFVP